MQTITKEQFASLYEAVKIVVGVQKNCTSHICSVYNICVTVHCKISALFSLNYRLPSYPMLPIVGALMIGCCQLRLHAQTVFDQTGNKTSMTSRHLWRRHRTGRFIASLRKLFERVNAVACQETSFLTLHSSIQFSFLGPYRNCYAVFYAMMLLVSNFSFLLMWPVFFLPDMPFWFVLFLVNNHLLQWFLKRFSSQWFLCWGESRLVFF